MKFFLLLVAVANVGLFMWEYKHGAFESAIDIAEKYDAPDQERILLVSELEAIHQAQASGPKPNIAASREKTPAAEAMPVSAENSAAPGNHRQAEQLKPPAKSDLAIAPEPLAGSGAEQKKAEAAPPKAKSDQPAPESKTVQPAIAMVEKKPDDKSGSEPASCYEAGPFANGNAYQLWKRELNAPRDAIKLLSRDGEVISNYLVYYPAAANKLQAEADMKMLKDKGIKDFWLLSKGKESGQISLGVFQNESRAQALKSQLLAKGIQAEVKPRYIVKPQRYARIKAGGKTLEHLNAMKQTYPAITVKPINQCW